MSTKKSGYSKSQIYRMYPGVPRNFIRESINDILKKSRGDTKAIFVKTLTVLEFDELKATFGEPVTDGLEFEA